MKQLDSRNSQKQGVRLDPREVKFKIRLADKMPNSFNFKELNNKNKAIQFQNFLDETIGKDLNISEVDELFLRKQGGVSSSQNITISERECKNCMNPQKGKFCQTSYEIIHYGKDRNPFRIFGFYTNTYFVLWKIDTMHKTHEK